MNQFIQVFKWIISCCIIRCISPEDFYRLSIHNNAKSGPGSRPQCFPDHFVTNKALFFGARKSSEIDGSSDHKWKKTRDLFKDHRDMVKVYFRCEGFPRKVGNDWPDCAVPKKVTSNPPVVTSGYLCSTFKSSPLVMTSNRWNLNEERSLVHESVTG